MTIQGESWVSGTTYSKGDYVYSSKRPGLLFIAQNNGKSHGKFSGRSGVHEPAWSLNGTTSDNTIVWKPLPATGTEKKWEAGRMYNVGNTVIPIDGSVEWGGVPYAFKAVRFVYEPDWPKEPNKTVTDNNIVWQSFLSSSFFLPKARLKESAFIELYKIIDYLALREDLILDEVRHKYNDTSKISNEALLSIVKEHGYEYITDALNLTERELRQLVAYLGLVNMLKGSKEGLHLVLELMGVTYRTEEWWETTPKGEPDTWNLFCEIDAKKAVSNLSSRITEFTRNYVYPTLDVFEMTYDIDLFHLDITMAGFVDAMYSIYLNLGWWVIPIMGGYVDKEIRWDGKINKIWLYRPNMKFGIIMAGFVDADYLVSFIPIEHNVIATESADRAIVRLGTQVKLINTHIQVSSHPSFMSAFILVDEVIPYTKSYDLQMVGFDMYVRIRHQDEIFGWSEWSDAVHYYVYSEVEKPSITSPVNGETTVILLD